MTHSLALELNDQIRKENSSVYGMLSALGRDLYFPKGILTQTAEAKQKAKRFNATIGIAKEKGIPMHLDAIMRQLPTLSPDEALGYAPSPGNPELRQEWGKALLEKSPSLRGKPVSLPLVTCGITHGLSLTADLFADPGDAVLIPDKVWGNYNMTFGVRRGASLVKYRLFNEKDGFNVEDLRKTIAAVPPGKKAIVVLNFPNNPTGYTVTQEEAGKIVSVLLAAAEQRPIVAVCDDAYFGLQFDPAALQESIFALLAGVHPRLLAIKLDGATKEDYVWGFRIGFLTFSAAGGPALFQALEKKAGGCVRGAVSNCPQPSQSLLLKSLRLPDYPRQKKEKFAVLQGRYEKAKDILSQPKFSEVWTPYPFNSGYFLCVRLNELNAEEYRLRLLEKYGVGVIATSETDIRVAFSCLEIGEIETLFNTMRECALELSGDARAKDLSLHKEAFEE